MKQVLKLYVYGADFVQTPEETRWEAGQGIRGDKYADGGEKQLQLISAAVQDLLPTGQGLCFRRFHGNVVVDGLNISEYPVGQHLRVGDAEAEVTGYKTCPFPQCPLHKEDVPCVLRAESLTAKVTGTGTVAVGDTIQLIR